MYVCVYIYIFFLQSRSLFLHPSGHEFIGNGFQQFRFLSIGPHKIVLLWVEQAGASAEPKSLSLWLPSFSDHFPSHILGSYLSS